MRNVQKEETDLRARTKDFALRIVWMFSALRRKRRCWASSYCDPGPLFCANYREVYRSKLDCFKQSSSQARASCIRGDPCIQKIIADLAPKE
jgi:hypothetical protein